MSASSPYVHDILLKDDISKAIHKYILEKKRIVRNQSNLKRSSIYEQDTPDVYVGEIFDLQTDPRADYELGSIVKQIANAEHRVSMHSSLNIFQLGENADEDRQLTAPPQLIPLQTQSELSLLWRTLTLFESMDDNEMLLEFYSDFLQILIKLEPLALSTKWHHIRHEALFAATTADKTATTSDWDSKDIPLCVVGLPSPPPPQKKQQGAIAKEVSQAAVPSSTGVPVIGHSELTYLLQRDGDTYKEEEELVNGRISSVHDPLGIVHRFFSSAEYLVDTLPPEQRSIPLSVCLTLAMKSGRAGLIMKVIYMLLRDENKDVVIEFDARWLSEIVNPKGNAGRESSGDKANKAIRESCNTLNDI